MSALTPPTATSEIDAAAQLTRSTADSSYAFETNDRLACWINRFEWFATGVIGLVAISLHIRFVTHVGGLWRDEANSVQLATLATFGEVWQNLDYDSFPILFFIVLRSWTGVFGIANDSALRALGLITGLGTIAALWLNARAVRAHRPVLSLAMIGLNPMLIRYGDSTRAYGLGILLIVLTFGSFWHLVDSPSPPGYKKIISATVLAMLSVQSLYYNCVLLLAIAAGAIVVALCARAWRTVGIVLAIGVLAAASLLPYLRIMNRMRAWTFLVSYSIDLAWLWKRACEVIRSPDPICIWLWTGLFIVGLGAAFGVVIFSTWRRPQIRRETKRELPTPVLFAAATLLVAGPAYAGFLWTLSYYTQPWYYITLAAFVACALNVVFGAWPIAAKRRISLVMRTGRLLVAFVFLCLAALPAWAEITIRHTNIDLMATQLQSRATKDDVILVSHWQYAVSLHRYYQGPAEIITLPPIDDYRFHRYDLALRQMMTPNSLRPVFFRLAQALRSGHRVFLVGALPSPRLDVPPPRAPPGYFDASGEWHGAAYEVVWPFQTGHFLHSHAARYVDIEMPVPGGAFVQEFEHLQFSMAEGWR